MVTVTPIQQSGVRPSFPGRDIPNTHGAGDTLVREARDRAVVAWEHDRENREDGFMDLRFLAGDQWPSAIRDERESAGRPCITINKLPQFLYQTANDIRQNPPGVKVVPAAGSGDEAKEIADIYAGLIRSIENASNAPDVYATAGGHAIACGQGSWRIRNRYVDDDVFDQELVLEGIRHPFSVLWDPASQKPDRSDATWCQVTQLVHTDDYKVRWPGASLASFDTPIPGQDPEAGLFWRNGEWLRVIEYWRKVAQKRKLCQFMTGDVYDVTNLTHNEKAHMAATLGEPVKERDVEGHKVCSSMLSAVDILEEEEDWMGRHIPIITTIGGEIPIDTKVVRFGLIRFARDAQQLYNYARSAAAESIGLAPKSPYLLTQKMIARHIEMWNTHNTTQRPYLVFDPDDAMPGGPTRLHPPETPVAFYQEQQIASEDMKSTTGIYDASLGARGNETSGVAINARDRQGDTATAHYQSNLVSSMLHCGRVMIDLIPKVYDTERIVSILGEDETEDMVPINHVVLSDRGEPILMNDLTQGKYEVRPRTGPSHATKRMEAADSMLNFVQAVPAAASVIGDLIAKNMDWPGADEIADRLKRTIPPEILGDDADPKDMSPEEQQAKQAAADTAKQQQQLMAKMQELQMNELMAKIDKMSADAEKTRSQIDGEAAKTQKTQADTEKTHIDAINAKIDALVKITQAMLTGIDIDPAALATMQSPMPMPRPAPRPLPGPAPMPGQPGPQAPGGMPMPPQPAPQPQPMQAEPSGPEALAGLNLPMGGMDEFLGGNAGGSPF